MFSLDAYITQPLVICGFNALIELPPAGTGVDSRPTPTGWLQPGLTAVSRGTPTGWVTQDSGLPGVKVAEAFLDAGIAHIGATTTSSLNAYVASVSPYVATQLDAVILGKVSATTSLTAQVGEGTAGTRTLSASFSAYVPGEIVHGMTEALREAYASAPIDDIVYHTLEIYHPAFSTPIRVVRDVVEYQGYIEETATRDAGALVTYVPYAFDIVPPDQQSAEMPRCVIEIDNVSREILAQVQQAVSSPEMVTVIYRQYLSSDQLPQNNPPLELTVFGISATVFRVTATCGFTDFVNMRYPKEEFTAKRFPGLIAS